MVGWVFVCSARLDGGNVLSIEVSADGAVTVLSSPPVIGLDFCFLSQVVPPQRAACHAILGLSALALV